LTYLYQMRLFLFLTFSFISLQIGAQKVTVAKEINVRSDYTYEILGNIEDHIILFRDKGNEYIAEVFDRNLSHILSREILFEKSRLNILGTSKTDTSWTIFYTYKEKKYDVLRSRTLDYKGDVIDSLTIAQIPREYGRDKTLMAISKNKTKILFFSRAKGERINLQLVDAEVDTFPTLWQKTIVLPEYRLRSDFRKIMVTDFGTVCVLLEDEVSNSSKHHLAIIEVDGQEGTLLSKVYYDGVYSTDMYVDFDNINRRIIIVGLYNKDRSDHAEGYYFLNRRLDELEEVQSFNQVPFGLDFIAEVYGKKIGKAKELKNYTIEDLLIRRDGGFVFFAEMNRRYNRRSAFGGGNGRYNGSPYRGRGWTDYYNEDVIALSTFPDGNEHWRTILYKKQFSQDDEGMYSSYFLFKTPSRLKLLYNDEIKKDNTVSEYILDPLGNYNRNSVLSTEYQKLKLRFRDAVQISSSELIVPSERSYNLSLVKIDFGK
jgi:hypothetical protein